MGEKDVDGSSSARLRRALDALKFLPRRRVAFATLGGMLPALVLSVASLFVLG